MKNFGQATRLALAYSQTYGLSDSHPYRKTVV